MAPIIENIIRGVQYSLKKRASTFNVGQFAGRTNKSNNKWYTDMRRLTTGIRSEKYVVKRFRRCEKRHRVYLHKPRQYSIAYCTPRLYGIAYCC